MTEPNAISTVVVKRDDGVANTTMAATPGGAPNVVLKALNPWKIVLIRTARVFLQSIAGAVTVSLFSNYASMKTALITAGVTALITAIQNSLELLAKLDQSVPEIRG